MRGGAREGAGRKPEVMTPGGRDTREYQRAWYANGGNGLVERRKENVRWGRRLRETAKARGCTVDALLDMLERG